MVSEYVPTILQYWSAAVGAVTFVALRLAEAWWADRRRATGATARAIVAQPEWTAVSIAIALFVTPSLVVLGDAASLLAMARQTGLVANLTALGAGFAVQAALHLIASFRPRA